MKKETPCVSGSNPGTPEQAGVTPTPDEAWGNNTYEVQVFRRDDGSVRRLSIRRHDYAPVADWRDKQWIKTRFCGPEIEAAELYPAESRVWDKANWYHLWCLPPGQRFPLGYETGEKSDALAPRFQRALAQRGDCTPLVRVKESNPIKLFLAVPVYQDMPEQFSRAIWNLFGNFQGEIKTQGDSLITRARNRLSADFLESGCSHCLWIDCDITPTVQDVERIISHDLPIVGGVYPLKVNGIPQWPVTFLLPELPPRRENGLQQVRYLGAGFFCVQRRVFERIIETHGPEIAYRCPLTGRTEYDFWRPFVHKGVYLSEDYGFCEVAGRLGFEVYADWGTTLGHTGTITYPAQSFNQEEVTGEKE
jgi:hypothetical protein